MGNHEETAGGRPAAEPAETMAGLAAELQTSSQILRKWARRRDLLPPPPAPGRPLTLTADQADAIRSAWHESRGSAAGPQTSSAAPGPAPAGWTEALAAVTAERDRLLAELATARETADRERRIREEAERGRHQAAETTETLRAAWWRWYALATARPWWRRLRGTLPPPPAELTAGRLLAPPPAEE